MKKLMKESVISPPSPTPPPAQNPQLSTGRPCCFHVVENQLRQWTAPRGSCPLLHSISTFGNPTPLQTAMIVLLTESLLLDAWGHLYLLILIGWLLEIGSSGKQGQQMIGIYGFQERQEFRV